MMLALALSVLSVVSAPFLTIAADLPFSAPLASTPRTGTQKIGLVFAYYFEFTLDSATEELLAAHYKDQIAVYMDWASDSKMNLDVHIFFHPLSLAEKDADGSCRSHPGLLFDDVAGFNATSFDAKEFNVLTTLGCSGSCASGAEGIECTTMYDQSALTACNASSATTLCERTFVHELLHALGLGYHANMYECTADDTTWRECTNVEYGGRLDVLGSTNTEGKISWGVSAKLRYDLHWLAGDDIVVVEKSDSPSSWTETSVDVTLSALDAAGGNAAVVRFTDSALSGLGLIWLEYRGGYFFDSNVAVANPGILAFHYGNALIDLNPSDDAFHVTLDVGAGVWTDSASGLQLETISADGSSAVVRVTFTSPPTCVLAEPTLTRRLQNRHFRPLS